MGKGKATRKKKSGSGGGGQGLGSSGGKQRQKKVPDPDAGASGGKRGKKKLPDASARGGAPSPRTTKKRGADGGSGSGSGSSSGSDRNVKHKSSSSEEDTPAANSPVSLNGTPQAKSPVTKEEMVSSEDTTQAKSPITEEMFSSEGSAQAKSPVTEIFHDTPQSPVEEFTVYRKEPYETSTVAKKSDRVRKPLHPQPQRCSSESPSSQDSGSSSHSSSKVSSGRSFAGVARQNRPSARSIKQPVPHEQLVTDGSIKQPVPHEQLVTDESVSEDFVSFLENYTAPGEKCPLYPVELKGMRERGCYELEVRFERILKHDKKLALQILKRTSIIRPSVQKFMTKQCFASEAEVLEKGSAILFQKPESVVPLKELLKNREKLISFMKNILGLQNESVTVLTELAQALLTGFLTEIRDQHKAGNSWNGDYGIDDMVVVDGCVCRITKKPHAYEGLDSGEQKSLFRTKKKEDLFGTARAADLKKLELIFSHVLLTDKKGKKLEGNAIPLFYDSLQLDLSNVTPKLAKDDKFWEYILNHPALKPSIIRSSFILVLRTFLDQLEHLIEDVKVILQDQTTADWRDDVRRCDLLKQVYDYEPEEKKKSEDKGYQPKEEKKKSEPFENTRSGLVVYNRNFIQHVNKIIKVFDTTHIEIFFSSQFKYLPMLLRDLVNANGFSRNARFYEAWRVYSSYRVELSTGASNHVARTLSFW